MLCLAEGASPGCTRALGVQPGRRRRSRWCAGGRSGMVGGRLIAALRGSRRLLVLHCTYLLFNTDNRESRRHARRTFLGRSGLCSVVLGEVFQGVDGRLRECAFLMHARAAPVAPQVPAGTRPARAFDRNWDRRHPSDGAQACQGPTRIILFIRHGQYATAHRRRRRRRRGPFCPVSMQKWMKANLGDKTAHCSRPSSTRNCAT